VTFGRVQGYSPRDAVHYLAVTRLAGIAAKATEAERFNASAAQLQTIAAGAGARSCAAALGAMPVNFLADLAITGGNSGSPTINAKGELVGLIFDMTSDSVASNWVFDPALTRSIHVDERCMLWVLQEVDRATQLLAELGIEVKQAPGPD